jgi:hypothetical protein
MLYTTRILKIPVMQLWRNNCWDKDERAAWRRKRSELLENETYKEHAHFRVLSYKKKSFPFVLGHYLPSFGFVKFWHPKIKLHVSCDSEINQELIRRCNLKEIVK